MIADKKDAIEQLARKLCRESGLDPEGRSPGPRSIVGVPEDAWPNWEYFWENAAEMILNDDAALDTPDNAG